jgi:hypothetical protein
VGAANKRVKGRAGGSAWHWPPFWPARGVTAAAGPTAARRLQHVAPAVAARKEQSLAMPGHDRAAGMQPLQLRTLADGACTCASAGPTHRWAAAGGWAAREGWAAAEGERAAVRAGSQAALSSLPSPTSRRAVVYLEGLSVISEQI